MSAASSLLTVEDLKVHFPVRSAGIVAARRAHVRAVDGVSLKIHRGETLGLVGESGSGKSTLARAILRLVPVTGGRIVLDGTEITHLTGSKLKRVRRRLQMVFQDPYSSLNPRHKVGRIVAEPLRAQRAGTRQQARERAVAMLESVGLPPDAAERYPNAFSGGQRQRIGLARALVVNPDVILLDEPVSSLDVSIQAQILSLLRSLQRQFGLTYVLIAHDLAVVRYVSDRIAVMYLGVVVEVGPADEMSRDPAHPYTRALISAVPIPDPVVERQRERVMLVGDIPSPSAPPEGCRFHTRCPYVQATRCTTEIPQLRILSSGRRVACHWAEEIAAGGLRPHDAPMENNELAG